MRTFLLIALWFSLVSINKTVQAQTLQFSQVLLVSTTQTVPANKVWKVEGVMPVFNGTAINQISINSTNIVVSAVGYTLSGNAFPLWLPAGTTLAAGSNVFRVSVIEFTVVP